MKTKSKTLFSFIDKSGRLDETQLEQDLDAVSEWYQDHGYIDVEVKEVRRERAGGQHDPGHADCGRHRYITSARSRLRETKVDHAEEGFEPS